MGANPPPILRLEPWIRSWWFENTRTTMWTFLKNHIVVLMAQSLHVKVFWSFCFRRSFWRTLHSHCDGLSEMYM